MMWEDHAFVVPAYGNSPFLAGCLRSLKEQDLASSRIVVTTSTPSDHIARAAREAGAELVVNARRAGIGADWNFALDAAGRRYVTLAHQDDVYYPDFLASARALFGRNPAGILSFSNFQQIDDRGQPKRSTVSVVKHLLSGAILGRAERVEGWRLRSLLAFGNPVPCSAVTFDLHRAAGFRFSESLASNLDWDAWWRLHERGGVFLYDPARLIGRRHNELTETSRLKRAGQRQSEDAEMFARIWPEPFARVLAVLYRLGY